MCYTVCDLRSKRQNIHKNTPNVVVVVFLVFVVQIKREIFDVEQTFAPIVVVPIEIEFVVVACFFFSFVSSKAKSKEKLFPDTYI